VGCGQGHHRAQSFAFMFVRTSTRLFCACCRARARTRGDNADVIAAMGVTLEPPSSDVDSALDSGVDEELVDGMMQRLRVSTTHHGSDAIDSPKPAPPPPPSPPPPVATTTAAASADGASSANNITNTHANKNNNIPSGSSRDAWANAGLDTNEAAQLAAAAAAAAASPVGSSSVGAESPNKRRSTPRNPDGRAAYRSTGVRVRCVC
jgi:hypothetical protein